MFIPTFWITKNRDNCICKRIVSYNVSFSELSALTKFAKPDSGKSQRKTEKSNLS